MKVKKSTKKADNEPTEEDKVEVWCDDCKKEFNSEYNLHVHMESEAHMKRAAAIKRLYQEPPPEK